MLVAHSERRDPPPLFVLLLLFVSSAPAAETLMLAEVGLSHADLDRHQSSSCVFYIHNFDHSKEDNN